MRGRRKIGGGGEFQSFSLRSIPKPVTVCVHACVLLKIARILSEEQGLMIKEPSQ